MEVSYSVFFLLPLSCALVGLFLYWCFYEMTRFASSKPQAGKVYRCQVCIHVYLDSRDVPLARCTRCGCLNEAVKR